MSKEAVADGAGPPPGAGAGAGKKTKLIIIIVAAVVALAAGGGGAWWFTRQKQHDAPAAGAAKQAEHKARVFAPLDPFTVNLRTTDRDRVLQIGIVFETTSSTVADAVKTNTPLIRSKVLYLLTSKSADDLATTEGKTQLAGQLLTVVRNGLAGDAAAGDAAADRGVIDVHFASFIIQ